MTIDIFIAGLIGMTLIAVVVAVFTNRRNTYGDQDRHPSEPSNQPE